MQQQQPFRPLQPQTDEFQQQSVTVHQYKLCLVAHLPAVGAKSISKYVMTVYSSDSTNDTGSRISVVGMTKVQAGKK